MSKNRRKFEICPNCSTLLKPEDNFCPSCGQENHDLNVPLGHIIFEFIESILHVDGTFWNTLKAIFSKPGKITNEFVKGKRKSYMPPARLYIFVSFLFFVFTNIVLDKSLKHIKTDSRLYSTSFSFIKDAKEIKFSKSETKTLASTDQEKINTLLKRKGIAFTDVERKQFDREFDSYIEKVRYGIWEDAEYSFPSATNPDIEITLSGNEIFKLANLTEKERIKYYKSKNIGLDPNYFYGIDAIMSSFPKTIKETKVFLQNGSNYSLTISGINVSEIDEDIINYSNARLDSILIVKKHKTSYFNRLILKNSKKLSGLNKDKDSMKSYFHQLTKTFSWVMFFLMPVVALILLIIYFRNRRNYYEYFIFSIHIHSVLFLLSAVEMCIRVLCKADVPFPWVSLIIMYFYILFALKNVYRQGWPKTIFKFVLLNFTYGFIFLFFLTTAFVYSAFTY